MSKRILSLLLVVMMMSTLFISLAHADGWTMYVYTDNGHTLNVRSDPTGGKNIIGRLNYGSAVSVRMTMANGWAAIDYAAGVGGGEVAFRNAVRRGGAGSPRVPVDDAVHDLARLFDGDAARVAAGVRDDGAVRHRPARQVRPA